MVYNVIGRGTQSSNSVLTNSSRPNSSNKINSGILRFYLTIAYPPMVIHINVQFNPVGNV